MLRYAQETMRCVFYSASVHSILYFVQGIERDAPPVEERDVSAIPSLLQDTSAERWELVVLMHVCA